MSKKKKIVLGDNLKEYQISGNPISGKFVDVTYGKVDFYTMTAKQADKLIDNKFPYLVKKKKASSE